MFSPGVPRSFKRPLQGPKWARACLACPQVRRCRGVDRRGSLRCQLLDRPQGASSASDSPVCVHLSAWSPSGDYLAVASGARLAEEMAGSRPSPSTVGRVLPTTSLARSAALHRIAGTQDLLAMRSQWVGSDCSSVADERPTSDRTLRSARKAQMISLRPRYSPSPRAAPPVPSVAPAEPPRGRRAGTPASARASP